MGFLDGIRGTFGTEQVVIIHNEGQDDETRREVEAHIQSKTGSFEIDTPIYEGDVVELDDPRGGRERRLAAQVDINRVRGHDEMSRIKVTWGKAAPARSAPVRRLKVENLHPVVIDAASDLFNDGHYESAVSEAFKSIEVRVRALVSVPGKTGSKLMEAVFGGASPLLDVTTEVGESAENEKNGFLALFRGAMIGVRNPKAHELFKAADAHQALEHLGFASLLHRRLDIAEAKLTGP
ncbi:MAG: TIGR02391 family protein [Mycolicibacterium neoaurum]|uniref:TIGR02391 family protein n=1 Tax=Mycolicibacterium neoaurum TaxID=1795 RepID=UPI002FF94D02